MKKTLISRTCDVLFNKEIKSFDVSANCQPGLCKFSFNVDFLPPRVAKNWDRLGTRNLWIRQILRRDIIFRTFNNDLIVGCLGVRTCDRRGDCRALPDDVEDIFVKLIVDQESPWCLHFRLVLSLKRDDLRIRNESFERTWSACRVISWKINWNRNQLALRMRCQFAFAFEFYNFHFFSRIQHLKLYSICGNMRCGKFTALA